MSRPNKDRIIPAASQTGINNPFSGLDPGALPPGPAEPPVKPAKPANPGRVLLRRETAHRGGRTVVVIHDFAPHISLARIEELGRMLRSACGCGGTVKGREIEIQGELAARIRELLEAEGFRVAGVK